MLGRRSEVTTSFDDDAVQDSSCVLPPSPLLEAACGSAVPRMVNHMNASALVAASHGGHVAVVEELLSDGRSEPNEKTLGGDVRYQSINWSIGRLIGR